MNARYSGLRVTTGKGRYYTSGLEELGVGWSWYRNTTSRFSCYLLKALVKRCDQRVAEIFECIGAVAKFFCPQHLDHAFGL